MSATQGQETASYATQTNTLIGAGRNRFATAIRTTARFGLFVMTITPPEKWHLSFRIDKEGTSSIKLRDVS